MAADDEIAEQAAGRPSPKPTVPLTEFDAVAERLNVVIDRLGELIAAQWAIAARKRPKPIKPYPRPITASQRVADRRRYASHAQLSLRLLGERSIYHRR